MKAILGVAGLLIVLGVIGMLAKKQLATAVPAPSATSSGARAADHQQQMNQMRQGIEQTLQQARPTGDEDKK